MTLPAAAFVGLVWLAIGLVVVLFVYVLYAIREDVRHF